MKTIISLLLIFTFCSHSSADDVPLTIGMGSDTVWLKTGVEPIGNESSILLPEYGIGITYGPGKTVESILMSPSIPLTSKGYTLHEVGLGENKKDVVNKLGKPAKEFKDKQEVSDAYESVWVLKDQLLDVGFWRTDQVTSDKHLKDTVAWVNLRKAYF